MHPILGSVTSLLRELTSFQLEVKAFLDRVAGSGDPGCPEEKELHILFRALPFCLSGLQDLLGQAEGILRVKKEREEKENDEDFYMALEEGDDLGPDLDLLDDGDDEEVASVFKGHARDEGADDAAFRKALEDWDVEESLLMLDESEESEIGHEGGRKAAGLEVSAEPHFDKQEEDRVPAGTSLTLIEELEIEVEEDMALHDRALRLAEWAVANKKLHPAKYCEFLASKFREYKALNSEPGVFLTYEAFKFGMQRMARTLNKPYDPHTCYICDFKSSGEGARDGLNKHADKLHLIFGRGFVCPHKSGSCKFKAYSRGEVGRHWQAMHDGDKMPRILFSRSQDPLENDFEEFRRMKQEPEDPKPQLPKKRKAPHEKILLKAKGLTKRGPATSDFSSPYFARLHEVANFSEREMLQTIADLVVKEPKRNIAHNDVPRKITAAEAMDVLKGKMIPDNVVDAALWLYIQNVPDSAMVSTQSLIASDTEHDGYVEDYRERIKTCEKVYTIVNLLKQHWIAITVDFPKQEITLYNSLLGFYRREAKIAVLNVKMFLLRQGRAVANFREKEDREFPKQIGGLDCGVFALAFIRNKIDNANGHGGGLTSTTEISVNNNDISYRAHMMREIQEGRRIPL